MGRLDDETGNFTDWWDNSTVDAFENKAQCVIDQSHNTESKWRATALSRPSYSRGEHSRCRRGECCIRGLERGRKHGARKLLPVLQSYTKAPVPFISYTTFRCRNESSETAVNILYQDARAPREGFAFSRSGSIIAGPWFGRGAAEAEEGEEEGEEGGEEGEGVEAFSRPAVA